MMRDKFGRFVKGHPVPAEWREKAGRIWRGRKLSRRHRKNISKALKEKFRNPNERRKQIDIPLLPWWADPERRLKIVKKIGEKIKGKRRPDLARRNKSDRMRRISSQTGKRTGPMNIKKINEDPELQRKRLRGLMKRPTKPELKFMQICEACDLPLKYVGNGELIIEGLNPDFANVHSKVLVEIHGRVWHDPSREYVKPVYYPHVRKHIFEEAGWKYFWLWDDQLAGSLMESIRRVKTVLTELRKTLESESNLEKRR